MNLNRIVTRNMLILILFQFIATFLISLILDLRTPGLEIEWDCIAALIAAIITTIIYKKKGIIK